MSATLWSGLQLCVRLAYFTLLITGVLLYVSYNFQNKNCFRLSTRLQITNEIQSNSRLQDKENQVKWVQQGREENATCQKEKHLAVVKRKVELVESETEETEADTRIDDITQDNEKYQIENQPRVFEGRYYESNQELNTWKGQKILNHEHYQDEIDNKNTDYRKPQVQKKTSKEMDFLIDLIHNYVDKKAPLRRNQDKKRPLIKDPSVTDHASKSSSNHDENSTKDRKLSQIYHNRLLKDKNKDTSKFTSSTDINDSSIKNLKENIEQENHEARTSTTRKLHVEKKLVKKEDEMTEPPDNELEKDLILKYMTKGQQKMESINKNLRNFQWPSEDVDANEFESKMFENVGYDKLNRALFSIVDVLQDNEHDQKITIDKSKGKIVNHIYDKENSKTTIRTTYSQSEIPQLQTTTEHLKIYKDMIGDIDNSIIHDKLPVSILNKGNFVTSDMLATSQDFKFNDLPSYEMEKSPKDSKSQKNLLINENNIEKAGLGMRHSITFDVPSENGQHSRYNNVEDTSERKCTNNYPIKNSLNLQLIRSNESKQQVVTENFQTTLDLKWNLTDDISNRTTIMTTNTTDSVHFKNNFDEDKSDKSEFIENLIKYLDNEEMFLRTVENYKVSKQPENGSTVTPEISSDIDIVQSKEATKTGSSVFPQMNSDIDIRQIKEQTKNISSVILRMIPDILIGQSKERANTSFSVIPQMNPDIDIKKSKEQTKTSSSVILQMNPDLDIRKSKEQTKFNFSKISQMNPDIDIGQSKEPTKTNSSVIPQINPVIDIRQSKEQTKSSSSVIPQKNLDIDMRKSRDPTETNFSEISHRNPDIDTGQSKEPTKCSSTVMPKTYSDDIAKRFNKLEVTIENVKNKSDSKYDTRKMSYNAYTSFLFQNKKGKKATTNKTYIESSTRKSSSILTTTRASLSNTMTFYTPLTSYTTNNYKIKKSYNYKNNATRSEVLFEALKPMRYHQNKAVDGIKTKTNETITPPMKNNPKSSSLSKENKAFSDQALDNEEYSAKLCVKDTAIKTATFPEDSTRLQTKKLNQNLTLRNNIKEISLRNRKDPYFYISKFHDQNTLAPLPFSTTSNKLNNSTRVEYNFTKIENVTIGNFEIENENINSMDIKDNYAKFKGQHEYKTKPSTFKIIGNIVPHFYDQKYTNQTTLTLISTTNVNTSTVPNREDNLVTEHKFQKQQNKSLLNRELNSLALNNIHKTIQQIFRKDQDKTNERRTKFFQYKPNFYSQKSTYQSTSPTILLLSTSFSPSPSLLLSTPSQELLIRDQHQQCSNQNESTALLLSTLISNKLDKVTVGEYNSTTTEHVLQSKQNINTVTVLLQRSNYVETSTKITENFEKRRENKNLLLRSWSNLHYRKGKRTVKMLSSQDTVVTIAQLNVLNETSKHYSTGLLKSLGIDNISYSGRNVPGLKLNVATAVEINETMKSKMGYELSTENIIQTDNNTETNLNIDQMASPIDFGERLDYNNQPPNFVKQHKTYEKRRTQEISNNFNAKKYPLIEKDETIKKKRENFIPKSERNDKWDTHGHGKKPDQMYNSFEAKKRTRNNTASRDNMMNNTESIEIYLTSTKKVTNNNVVPRKDIRNTDEKDQTSKPKCSQCEIKKLQGNIRTDRTNKDRQLKVYSDMYIDLLPRNGDKNIRNPTHQLEETTTKNIQEKARVKQPNNYVDIVDMLYC